MCDVGNIDSMGDNATTLVVVYENVTAKIM